MMLLLRDFRSAVTSVLATLMLTSATPTYAGCMVYEDRDYRGARFGLNGNNWLMMGACAEDIGRKGGGRGYCRRNWNDRISSYRVTSDCYLRLWADADDYSPAGVRFSRNYGVNVSYVGDSWNDKASWASCYCR